MKKVIKKKKVVKRAKVKKSFLSGGANNGMLYGIGILGVAIAFGLASSAGAIPEILNLRTPPPPANPYSCCDSGDGPNCRPIMDQQITFNGDTYALLKSKIYAPGTYHIAPAELAPGYEYPPSFTPDGRRIFVNTSDKTSRVYPPCKEGQDYTGVNDPSRPGRKCFGLNNEQLIYVCADTPEECAKNVNRETIPFDVYIRLKDGPVPYELTVYCPKPEVVGSEKGQQVIGLPTPSGAANLQLETFAVKQEKGTYRWLGAWCKPANYFYPSEKADIHFDVAPKGDFTYTDPKRPEGGWKFTAYPDGNLVYKGKNYPYIYWDAAIPNNLINKPRTGYSVTHKDLEKLLRDLLPKMGLNEKESADFVEYWIDKLPDSPYYFVGVLPRSEIDSLAPLSISPKPTSSLRVSLYFEAIKSPVEVEAPILEPFTRAGFTMVEWGGIFDTQKHPGFSCLM